jgi:hypothetical protein
VQESRSVKQMVDRLAVVMLLSGSVSVETTVDPIGNGAKSDSLNGLDGLCSATAQPDANVAIGVAILAMIFFG